MKYNVRNKTWKIRRALRGALTQDGQDHSWSISITCPTYHHGNDVIHGSLVCYVGVADCSCITGTQRMSIIMPCPHRVEALSADGRRLSVRLSVRFGSDPISRERKGIASWKSARRKPMTRETVTPFRGQKVKGAGSKVTSKHSFSFDARPTASVRSDANSWWRHLTNRDIIIIIIIIIKFLFQATWPTHIIHTITHNAHKNTRKHRKHIKHKKIKHTDKRTLVLLNVMDIIIHHLRLTASRWPTVLIWILQIVQHLEKNHMAIMQYGIETGHTCFNQHFCNTVITLEPPKKQLHDDSLRSDPLLYIVRSAASYKHIQ